MKKLMIRISLGTLLFAGFGFAQYHHNPINLTMDLEPSIFSDKQSGF